MGHNRAGGRRKNRLKRAKKGAVTRGVKQLLDAAETPSAPAKKK